MAPVVQLCNDIAPGTFREKQRTHYPQRVCVRVGRVAGDEEENKLDEEKKKKQKKRKMRGWG